MSSSLIPPHGGYRELKSFQHAELVYDSTLKSCNRFIDLRSRTHDQMVQAARSGRQHPTAIVIRRLAYEKNRAYSAYSSYIEKAPPEVAANTIICLIHQTNYLLDQQLRQLEQAFLKDGGFTERLYQARVASRGRQ